jgi:hypothetical protein
LLGPRSTASASLICKLYTTNKEPRRGSGKERSAKLGVIISLNQRRAPILGGPRMLQSCRSRHSRSTFIIHCCEDASRISPLDPAPPSAWLLNTTSLVGTTATTSRKADKVHGIQSLWRAQRVFRKDCEMMVRLLNANDWRIVANLISQSPGSRYPPNHPPPPSLRSATKS